VGLVTDAGTKLLTGLQDKNHNGVITAIPEP
jgi:hypothetical protein